MIFSGIPLETLELSSEFGTLNFEELPEDPQLKTQITELNEQFTPATKKNSDFEEEMEKVIKIMKIAGNDLPASTFKTLMTDLVVKAKENSENKDEETEKVKMVKTLVHLFKETNAQRAQETFEERKPESRPVQEQLEEVLENLPQPPVDLSQILIEKAKKRPTQVPDFNIGLEAPIRNQRPRLHMKPKNLSHILINKAKNKPTTIRDFESGLDVPVFIEKSKRPKDFLNEKAKARPSEVKDFDSGIALPALAEIDDYDYEEFPSFEAPDTTTTKSVIKVMNLSEILEMPKSKELIEDHIMDMILESPDRAAADLAGLFDIKTEKEKEDTEKELHIMMEKDPLAVTSAFTDLIIAQKSTPIGSTQGPPIPSTPIFEPVKIEDVPEAVKGKMERMRKKPNNNDLADTEDDVNVKIGSKPGKTIEISSQLLDQMMKLIEDGQLSHKEVIEEMINNGLLPVEVTEIGKIPIIVGSGRKKPATQAPRNLPLRKLPIFRETPPREAVNRARLKELKDNGPQMVMRDHHDFIKEVDAEDPDFDYEMVDMHAVVPQKDARPAPLIEVSTTSSPVEKDIEILSSMMDLFEQGLISDTELEQMVIMMEKEGVLDVDLKELGIEEESTTPKTETYSYSNYNFKPPSGPSVDDREPRFGFKQGISPFVAIDNMAKDELNNPFNEDFGKDKPSSYSTFSMGRPMAITSTPKPPSLPPPSQESVHNAPFFEDLRMNNPFQAPFENDFHNANMAFDPKPTKASRLEETVKPGPAPPAWLSARVPAPPSFQEPEFTPPQRFKKPESEFEFLPITSPSPGPFHTIEEEMFDSLRTGPREPFPPPQDFKRHISQPVPLVLHSHEGQEYAHPHFDIPSEIIDPDSFYRSPRKIPHPRRTSKIPYQSFSREFLPRQGRLASTFGLVPIPFVDGLPGITGLREVDKRLDRIRQSYLKGDGLGSATSAFEK